MTQREIPSESAPATDAPRRRRNPWWIPPFLGRVPDLDPGFMRLLGLIALGLVFASYNFSMINSALKQIAEDLAISTRDTGFYTGAIRLGGIAAFLVLPWADRVGRRRVFLASLVGMSIGSIASAASQTALQFTVLQMITRMFMMTVSASALVIVTEEVPAEHRGWAIGMISALGSAGYGLGAGLYAAVEQLPHGWRALYAFGGAPLLFLPALGRRLGETGRFERHRRGENGGESPGAAASWLAPVIALARRSPRRVVGVGLAGILSAMGGVGMGQYTSYFAQTEHGWLPWQYSVMVLIGGAVGIAGNVVAGRLSDRIGRRRVGLAFFALYPLAAILLFAGPAWSLVAGFAMAVFCSQAGEVVVRAFSAELFPTSRRATSTGWLVLVQTLGWSTGLIAIGFGTGSGAELGRVIIGMSFTVATAGLCLLLLPETSRRELESISS